MVHDNPGEAAFDTGFRNPEKLAEYGYNGQVFKHLNCAADFSSFDPDLFPEGSLERLWISGLRKTIRKEIAAAKQAGLSVYFHIDLFVLPAKLVEKYREGLLDKDGRISMDAPLTLKIHRVMFDELFQLFPEIDGLIIRVGETYLFDAPYHVGNGPIRSSQYTGSEVPVSTEQDRYVRLIRFLREEICIRHERLLFFRTWDCYPDRFHASLPYYLAVTDQIPVHEKLFFSIKHTALDFWRFVNFNPCIGRGKHRQIIEVQCQREYEGKGAYPDYIMDKVLNGFPETEAPRGLREFSGSDQIAGIFGWSRGGGWYGPYLKDELWCRLNAYVLAGWAKNPAADEETIFGEFCKKELKLTDGDAGRFREISRMSADAVLHGRYCSPYDRTLHGRLMPTSLWMRDDRLGGLNELAPVFEKLKKDGLLRDALQEKELSVSLWHKIVLLSQEIQSGTAEFRTGLHTSAVYGERLFRLIACAWNIFARYYEEIPGRQWALDDFEAYDAAVRSYKELSDFPSAASLYCGKYLNLPGDPECPGMDESIALCRRIARKNVKS